MSGRPALAVGMSDATSHGVDTSAGRCSAGTASRYVRRSAGFHPRAGDLGGGKGWHGSAEPMADNAGLLENIAAMRPIWPKTYNTR